MTIQVHLLNPQFQHTAARRRLETLERLVMVVPAVSTHSRPKAAGYQPFSDGVPTWFQHTAARRRLVDDVYIPKMFSQVSTHSRPKAAGITVWTLRHIRRVSTHSRPKAAGRRRSRPRNRETVSTHSRPKAAGGHFPNRNKPKQVVSTHSRPKAAGTAVRILIKAAVFQHTAARRRLAVQGLQTRGL